MLGKILIINIFLIGNNLLDNILIGSILSMFIILSMVGILILVIFFEIIFREEFRVLLMDVLNDELLLFVCEIIVEFVLVEENEENVVLLLENRFVN